MTDVLLVSLGTTRGWRVADSILAGQLERAGASVLTAEVKLGAADRLRRGYPINDFVEAAASRHTLRAALAAHRPRAVVMCSTTSALLVRRLEVPYAVRLDTPASMTRLGALNSPVRALERRSIPGARVVIPFSATVLPELPPGSPRAVVLPAPVEASGPREEEADSLAVAYVPDPRPKGLDIVAGAWAASGVRGTLEVFGVERERALGYLRREGIPEPPGIRWRGLTPPAEFRAALRRARVLIAGARWEDFGQAPLEGLADGALLATVPSGGPFEALRPARALDPRLVAESLTGDALAACVRTAFAMDPGEVAAYRERTAELLAPYRPDTLQSAVEDELLPALLAR